MSKEYLEAFGRITLHTEYDNDGSYDCLQFEDDCKLVDEALERLESIDNAEPSEALKCLEGIKDALWDDDFHYQRHSKLLDTIEQSLLKAQEQEKENARYKQLEEQLGCPLDLVLIPYFISGLKKVWYHNQWCDVVRVVAYEEATTPYMEVRCKDYDYLKFIPLTNYKKTFWLKEDKSE